MSCAAGGPKSQSTAAGSLAVVYAIAMVHVSKHGLQHTQTQTHTQRDTQTQTQTKTHTRTNARLQEPPNTHIHTLTGDKILKSMQYGGLAAPTLRPCSVVSGMTRVVGSCADRPPCSMSWKMSARYTNRLLQNCSTVTTCWLMLDCCLLSCFTCMQQSLGSHHDRPQHCPTSKYSCDPT